MYYVEGSLGEGSYCLKEEQSETLQSTTNSDRDITNS